jgi:hypothetical protein
LLKREARKVEDAFSIEIIGKAVILRNGERMVKKTNVKDFVRQILLTSDASIFQDPLPDGVRFVRKRGNRVTVVAMELRPQCRQVKWIEESSEALFGYEASYEQVRLAFPYIVLFILFGDGRYTGYQQAYYRVAPITSEHDPLLFPNLRNCRDAHGLKCWLCLNHWGEIESIEHLPWDQRIQRVVEYLWVRAFNKSADANGHASYWTLMKKIDERVSSVQRWQEASAKDPSFPLKVKWKPAEVTVKQAMDTMLDIGVGLFGGAQCDDLINIVNQCESHES